MHTPDVPVQAEPLSAYGKRLGRLVHKLGTTVQGTLIRYREDVVDRQLEQARIAWAAMEAFATACTLSRWDHDLTAAGRSNGSEEFAAAEWFVQDSLAQAERHLDELHSPLDTSLLAAAQHALQC